MLLFSITSVFHGMGVKGLWTVLAPIAEKKPLWELKNQTVAVDLSGWICENHNVDNFNANLYLRYLFEFEYSVQNLRVNKIVAFFDVTLRQKFIFSNFVHAAHRNQTNIHFRRQSTHIKVQYDRAKENSW